MTLLSIIIPVKDGREKILKTIESLEGILGPEVELVIQDHEGSCGLLDSTLNENISVSVAKDKGCADACNMCVARAKGKYVMFWGAGETAIKDNFLKSLEMIKEKLVDILFSATFYPELGLTAVPDPSMMEVDMRCATCGVMILKNLFLHIGGFDQHYIVAPDYVMFINLLRAASNYRINKDPIVEFRLGGMSTGDSGIEAVIEHELIRMRMCGKNRALASLDLASVLLNYAKGRIVA